MKEYAAIAAHYGTRAARRSGVPYIEHIDAGLRILDAIGASELAKRAFCLHPFVQEDADLAAHGDQLPTDDMRVIVRVMEYRHIANATLSARAITSAADIPLSPLPDVNAMLVADKVQNYRDFLRHHAATHPRRDALDRYFRLWLERLGIDDARRDALLQASQRA